MHHHNEKLNWFPKPLPKFIILRCWLQIEIGYTNNIHDAKDSRISSMELQTFSSVNKWMMDG